MVRLKSCGSPSLRILWTRGIIIVPQDSADFKELQTLRLLGDCPQFEQNYNLGAENYLVHILRRCENLRELDLTGPIFPLGDWPVQPITLGKLKRLTMFCEAPAVLLDRLHLPVLTVLHVSVVDIPYMSDIAAALSVSRAIPLHSFASTLPLFSRTEEVGLTMSRRGLRIWDKGTSNEGLGSWSVTILTSPFKNVAPALTLHELPAMVDPARIRRLDLHLGAQSGDPAALLQGLLDLLRSFSALHKLLLGGAPVVQAFLGVEEGALVVPASLRELAFCLPKLEPFVGRGLATHAAALAHVSTIRIYLPSRSEGNIAEGRIAELEAIVPRCELLFGDVMGCASCHVAANA